MTKRKSRATTKKVAVKKVKKKTAVKKSTRKKVHAKASRKTVPKKKTNRRSGHRTRAQWDAMIREHIDAKDCGELAEFVWLLVQRYPELRKEFQERISLSEGDSAHLVAEARLEIQEATSQPAWQDRWSDNGFTPDFDPIKHRFERLLDLGHADDVVELGRLFIERVIDQVEQSHDEGEVAMEAADCMPIIFHAVKKSSLSDPEKILMSIDACLQDDYDVLGDAVDIVLNTRWSKRVWSDVADLLQHRLGKPSVADNEKEQNRFHKDYGRDHQTGWLLSALEKAGREDELLAVYEQEARMTGSYQRLVKYLISERKYDDAQRWATEGIEKVREKWPGDASSLAAQLCEVANRRRQWDFVAADAAWRFFDRPSAPGFAELMKHASKAKCEPSVRRAALAMLETGKLPVRWTAVTKGKQKGERTLAVDSSWPLPVPDYLALLMDREKPMYEKYQPRFDILLDIAIDAKQPDEVLRWYDKLTEGKKSTTGRFSYGRMWCGDGQAGRVAKAVTKSHPERALSIYRNAIDLRLPHADKNSYSAVGRYLSLMRPIMASLKRLEEWKSLVAEIREQNRRRPRFMEVLDRLK